LEVIALQIILGLLFAVIFVYLGVSFEPSINTTISTITTPSYGAGVTGLNSVLLLVFAAFIIFGLVKQMSFAA
jgi:hypothetical protein